ncbi:hypothetical protein [Ensifer canadensis]
MTSTRYRHPDLKVIANAQTRAVTEAFLQRDRLVTDADGNRVQQTGYAAFGERTIMTILKMKGTIPMWYLLPPFAAATAAALRTASRMPGS